MGGYAKRDGLECGTDFGQSTWEEDVNDRVSETPSNHLPNSPSILLDEDDDNVDD